MRGWISLEVHFKSWQYLEVYQATLADIYAMDEIINQMIYTPNHNGKGVTSTIGKYI